VQAAEGHWAEAARLAREGLTLAEGANGFDHPDSITVALDLAHDVDKLDRHADALELLDRIVAALARKGGDRDTDIASALIESAHVLQELGRSREAVDRLERAVGLLPLEKGDSRRAAMARFALAEALWANGGDHGRARQLAVEAKQSYAKASRANEAQHIVDWLKTHVH
jgi:tetratricopeptide (TPR) repeat protein